MEAANFIYVPTWVRRFALALLGLGCIAGLGSASYFVVTGGDSNADYILAGISLAQISISGLAIALVLFYSEREISPANLLRKTYTLLEHSLPERFRQLRLPGADLSSGPITPDVIIEHLSNDLGANYLLSNGRYTLRIWVFVNVHRVYVVYFFPASIAKNVQNLENVLGAATAGAEHVGYKVEILQVKDGGALSFEVRCQVTAEKRFLVDSLERLFWINDIAEMTRAIFLNALRGGVLPVEKNLKPRRSRR